MMMSELLDVSLFVFYYNYKRICIGRHVDFLFFHLIFCLWFVCETGIRIQYFFPRQFFFFVPSIFFFKLFFVFKSEIYVMNVGFCCGDQVCDERARRGEMEVFFPISLFAQL